MWRRRTRSSLPAPPSLALTAENPAYDRFAIGEGTYGFPTVLSWGEGATLTIGRYCSIASGVTIFLGGEHRTDWVTTYPFSVFLDTAKHISGHPRTKGDVTIGSDVWIGQNATILSGVAIGHGAVIGAASVVTSDVDPYAIVAGNPAELIRLRFERETIEALLEIQWWNWPKHKVESSAARLLSSDISAFVESCEAERDPAEAV